MKDDEIAGDCSDDRAASYAGTDPVPIAAPAPAWSRLPVELRQRRQWLLAGPDAKGALKVPTSVWPDGAPRPGSSTNRETWLTFEAATAWAEHRRLGIGYVLAWDDPFTCIDLDVKNAVNAPDDPESWTTPEQIALFTRMAASFDSYTERSQSGQGLHIWCFGKIGPGRKRDGVELYSQERFIACTGDVWIDRPIREHQDFLTNMASQMLTPARGKGKRILATLVDLPQRKTDEQFLEGVHYRWSPEKREKFMRLWHGLNPDGTPMRAANGNWNRGPYQSQSEADMALLTDLCLTIESNEQVRRPFRMSVLGQRAKARKNDRYLNETLAVIRPHYGTTQAYSVRPREPEGDALNTPPVIAISIDEKVGAWFDRVAATMPKFG